LEDVWEEALEEEKQQVQVAVLNNLAAVLLKQHNYTLAVTKCQQVLELDARQTKAMYRLAQAQLALHEYDAALKTAQQGQEVGDR
jgi:tetratricopeptide (TPR) repeat protein